MPGKIRYRRASREEPEVIHAFGRNFEHGKFETVDDKTLAKARGNPGFEVEGETTFGDEEHEARDEGPEANERRQRAQIAQQGADETRKAKQAEAKGGSHRDDRA